MVTSGHIAMREPCPLPPKAASLYDRNVRLVSEADILHYGMLPDFRSATDPFDGIYLMQISGRKQQKTTKNRSETTRISIPVRCSAPRAL